MGRGRNALFVFYVSGGIIQMGNTVYWTCDGKGRRWMERRIPVADSLVFPFYVATSLVSAVTWPVSLPVMAVLDTKYAKE